MLRNNATFLPALLPALLMLNICMPASAAFIAGDRILVDLGQTAHESGTATTPATDGNYWNNFALAANDTTTPPTTLVADLIRASDGTATGGLLEIAASTFDNVGIGGADNPNASQTNAMPASATRDTFFFNASNNDPKSATLEFRNLDTSLTYDLSIFGSVPSGTRPLTEITVDSVTQSYNPVDNGETGTGTNTADFIGLSPDSNGTISFVVTLDGAGAGHINTIELTVVPEPASLSLMAVVGLVVLRRGRRS